MIWALRTNAVERLVAQPTSGVVPGGGSFEVCHFILLRLVRMSNLLLNRKVDVFNQGTFSPGVFYQKHKQRSTDFSKYSIDQLPSWSYCSCLYFKAKNEIIYYIM
uniref:Major sperm protein n=1 Tax=Parascaris univalens TaxID=6257 RepID=A0A915A9X2_PARUN